MTGGELDAVERLLLACVDEAIPRPGIFPTPDGGVQLEWTSSEFEIEVEFPSGPVGTVRYLWYSKVSDREDERAFPVDDVDDLIDTIRGGLDGNTAG